MVFLRDMSYDLGRVKVSLQLFGCHTLTMLGSPTFEGNELTVAPLQDAIVTTRGIMFLVGDPELNLHLPLESWEGGQPQIISV